MHTQKCPQSLFTCVLYLIREHRRTEPRASWLHRVSIFQLCSEHTQFILPRQLSISRWRKYLAKNIQACKFPVKTYTPCVSINWSVICDVGSVRSASRLSDNRMAVRIQLVARSNSRVAWDLTDLRSTDSVDTIFYRLSERFWRESLRNPSMWLISQNETSCPGIFTITLHGCYRPLQSLRHWR